MEAIGFDGAPATVREHAHFAVPFAAQIETCGSGEGGVGPTRVHAQAKGGQFSGAPQRIKRFVGGNRATSALERLAIKRRAGPVGRANTTHVTRRARSQSVIGSAPPIVDVVGARPAGEIRM